MKHDENLIPTRQSLLSRLKDWNDQESWKTFFDTYWRLIYHTALKAGLSEAEAQDVVQETVITVLKALPTLDYKAERGSFKGWLLRLTSWRIGDQLRRRRRDMEPSQGPNQRGPDTSTRTATVERVEDPGSMVLVEESAWEEEWERNLMDAAIERVKQKVDGKQYQVFDLYVLKNWPAWQVARTLQVSASSVYLAKHRVSKMIKKALAELHAKPI